MFGSISQSYRADFLAGLRSLFSSSNNGAQKTATPSHASAENPSPAAPKKLNFLQAIQNFFQFVKPTKTVPVAPQPLKSNAAANSSRPSAEEEKVMTELSKFPALINAEREKLQAANTLLKQISGCSFSPYQVVNYQVNSGLRLSLDDVKTEQNNEINRLKAQIDAHMNQVKVLEAKQCDLMARAVKLKDQRS